MSCGSCSADNRDPRRFCGACGATLGACCVRCSFRNDLGDRYCGGCGTPTDAAPRSVRPLPQAAETAAAVLLSARASARRRELTLAELDGLFDPP